jgi:magnesium-transporting ATPase (P-type)
MENSVRPAERRGDWHALPVEEILRALAADQHAGLSRAEAAARLTRFGPNRLAERRRRGPLARFLLQFHNVLMYVLLAAACFAALLGHWVDSTVILAVVLVNAVIGFVQEGRAEEALAAIRSMLAPRAAVLRDGRRQSVPAEELVPGDVVLLEAGDKVPADLRLLRVKGLKVQEAVLTGESVPVEKSVEPIAADSPLGDRACMAYSGTLVAAGTATGVVAASGDATEIGRISGMLAEVEELTTPLLRQMSQFSRWLTLAIVALAAAVFAFGLLARGETVSAMFMVAVALAVAAIPEGLPTILTVTLAIGVQRMARRHAIVRRLPAVETLGAVSTICSDKTGTLTRNEMTLRALVTAERDYEITGVGYEPEGEILLEGARVEPEQDPLLTQALRAGALCNDAALHRRDGRWHAEGDPMEVALVTAGLKAGLDAHDERARLARTDVIPFDAQHRFMATLHHDHEGHGWVFLKGAPERVLDLCRHERHAAGDAPLERARWERQIEAIAARGQRVLAVAVRDTDRQQTTLDFADVERGMVLLGLYGLIDPPRAEAIEAVRECRSAGIRVKMITGDHAATARAIAAQLHLENDREALTGQELERLDDAALREVAVRVDVFARTTPEHKLRLVTALQARGQVVAMTGDGVNDAPALKRADVGVAMGLGGTEAAKEAAEMVLADDNFASIAHAVREGRTVYDNLKKAILFLLPINGGESFAIIAAVLAGVTLPVTPLQVLWVNMVSSVALAMTLAFEPTEPDAMRRPPRPPGEPLLSAYLLWRILLVSTLFVAGIFGMFAWSQHHGATLEEARTYAVNTLVAMEVFYLFNVRYLGSASLTLRGVIGTRAVLIAIGIVAVLQMTFTYAPFMNRFFDTRPVDLWHGVEIVAVGIALFALLEFEKWLGRRRARAAAPA